MIKPIALAGCAGKPDLHVPAPQLIQHAGAQGLALAVIDNGASLGGIRLPLKWEYELAGGSTP